MEPLQLTEEEKTELKKFHKSIRDKNSGDRIKAILMLNDGYSCIEIAKILLLDEKTIRRWKDRYLTRKNITRFIFHDCKGYTGKLSKTELESISKYVEENLISDSKQVRLFIRDKFEITYTKNGCITWLHQLGFTYKQTTIMPSGMNPAHQKKFKENYEEFASQLKEDETIVFMDGMHPTHNLETSRAWIKIGKKKEMLTNSGRQRCNLNGFYNPFTQDVFVKEYPSINAQATLDSFAELEAFYPNKATIYVIIDNARYYKNTMVKAWLETSRIEPIYLPPYSPNLNLIERFWKHLKREVILNQFYPKFSEFKKALLDFCNKSSPSHKLRLKRAVGSKLHLLTPVF
jgi:transposase